MVRVLVEGLGANVDVVETQKLDDAHALPASQTATRKW